MVQTAIFLRPVNSDQPDFFPRVTFGNKVHWLISDVAIDRLPGPESRCPCKPIHLGSQVVGSDSFKEPLILRPYKTHVYIHIYIYVVTPHDTHEALLLYCQHNLLHAALFGEEAKTL